MHSVLQSVVNRSSGSYYRRNGPRHRRNWISGHAESTLVDAKIVEAQKVLNGLIRALREEK